MKGYQGEEGNVLPLDETRKNPYSVLVFPLEYSS
jgi:hypothetical protein